MNPKDYGYDDKEALVKDHWRRYASRANWNWQKTPVMRVAVRHRQYPIMPPVTISVEPDNLVAQTIDIISFSLRPAQWRDRVIHQVVCDGIVCAEG